MRARLVYDFIEGRGITDERVLLAMTKIPREAFAPADIAGLTYSMGELPIDMGQTMNDPFIVAYMTEALKLNKDHTVLEVGTGSGYHSAILATLSKSVYSVEIIPSLVESAQETLWGQGHENVFVKVGDGANGWVEKGPFDRILLSVAVDSIPENLLKQLAPGGILVAPVGNRGQYLFRITKSLDGKHLDKELLLPVKFTLMAHETPKESSQGQKVA